MDFPLTNVESFSTQGTNGALIGHYTQMVWGETEYIGCGAIYYKDNNADVSNYPYRQTLVCNYHPPGNHLGKPVYAIGQPVLHVLVTSEKNMVDFVNKK